MEKGKCKKCGNETPVVYVPLCETCFFIEVDNYWIPRGVRKDIDLKTGEIIYKGIGLKEINDKR